MVRWSYPIYFPPSLFERVAHSGYSTEGAFKRDPRIKRHKAAEKEARRRAKQEKIDAIRRVKEEQERKEAEERERKEKEAKAKAEEVQKEHLPIEPFEILLSECVFLLLLLLGSQRKTEEGECAS